MTITPPIQSALSNTSVPSIVQALAQQQLMQSQGGLINQQAAAEQQAAEQAAIATRIQQARLPIMLQGYANAQQGMQTPPGGAQGPGVSPGGMPLGAPPAPSPSPTAAADQTGVASTNTNPMTDANPLDANTVGPGGAKTQWYNPQAVDAALRQRYFVNQAGTPQENQQLYAANITHDPGLIGAAQMRLQQGVKGRIAQSQYSSSNTFDALTSVVDAGEGGAMAQLAAVAPGVAKRLAAQVKDPEKQDADARAYAAYVAGEIHQYTGRPVVQRPDGFYVDKLTGQPVAGVGRSGLSMAQGVNLAQEGMTPVAVPQSDGSTRMVPRWQAPGQNAPNLQSWVMNMARAGGAPGAQPGITGGPQADAQKIAAQAATAVQTRAAQQAAAPAIAADPVLGKALADPTFNAPSAAPTFGTSITPENEVLQKETAASTASLSSDAKLTTDASQQALTYLQAAQRILQAKGAPVTGLYGPALAEINRIAPHGIDASNFQMVTKFLSNAALQNARAIYGPRMSQMEVRLQLQDMNPSKNMQYPAIAKLLDENIRNAKYALGSAQRIPIYLAHNKNPMWFPEWNAKYWPQQKIVNDGLSAVGTRNAPRAAPAVGSIEEGYRFNGGNPALKVNWTKVTQ